MSIQVRLITPDKIVWDTNAEEIILPSVTGQIGVLKNHATLITALEIGLLRIKSENKWNLIVLTGGFAEIDENEVVVLVKKVEEIKEEETEEYLIGNIEKITAEMNSAETEAEKIIKTQEVKIITSKLQAKKNY
jgi:F-type H+-transporting ATPase subunit epsilon